MQLDLPSLAQARRLFLKVQGKLGGERGTHAVFGIYGSDTSA